jgi:hypothetical protein
MRRSVVTTTITLALALAPELLFAQTPQQPPAGEPPAGQQPAAGQPPAGQPAAGQPPAADTAKPPRLTMNSGAAVLLYQIKPDQTATFEEMLGKVHAGMLKSDNPVRKQQLAGWKIYKAAEPMGGNALYVCVIDPAVPAAEYDFFMLLAEGLGPEAGTPENQALFKKYSEVFAAGASRLSLTPVSSFSGM